MRNSIFDQLLLLVANDMITLDKPCYVYQENNQVPESCVILTLVLELDAGVRVQVRQIGLPPMDSFNPAKHQFVRYNSTYVFNPFIDTH